ncbi:hypothetical protein EX30DRAFT_263894 [Ascodesmis nigricans]|uniref:RRM domain-containing protein n=1 Tax=Ascodesmis nigricans TaxID=341454 RepID=A0A4S2MXM8_9PEZI|nr:hypothetical protein EX30DRAFT_263894 [Ascodesmis nigricans]
MGEWSGTRLYLGNLPKGTTEKEIEDFFKEIGHGTITEIKLMDGFGFIQYDSADDAKDIVPTFHGRDFKGNSLIVQFARGTRHRDGPREFGPPGGGASFTARPRRTPFRMIISGLPPDTSWQDLKDFARKSNENVVYSDVSRDRDGRGTVEFETADDLNRAVAQLDKTEYRGYRVSCIASIGEDIPPSNGGRYNGGGGGYGPPPRGRSRSPPRHGGYRGRYSPPVPRGGYSPPPRGGGGGGAPYPGSRGRYESPPPHRGSYRERSPPPSRRDPYYSSAPRDRSPPPRRPPPMDDYPPAPPRSSGGYDAPPRDYPPRDRGYEDQGYHSRSGGGRYDDRHGGYRSPPPRGRTPPPVRPPPSSRPYDDYDRRRY